MLQRGGSIPLLAKRVTVLVLIQQSGRPCWECEGAFTVPLLLHASVFAFNECSLQGVLGKQGKKRVFMDSA